MSVVIKPADLQSINTFVKSIKDLQEINTTGTLDNVIDTLIKGLGTFVLACDTVGKVATSPEIKTTWRNSYHLANLVEDEGQEQEPDTAEDTAELPELKNNYNARTMPIGYEEGMGVYL
jgi:hypothetical protein